MLTNHLRLTPAAAATDAPAGGGASAVRHADGSFAAEAVLDEGALMRLRELDPNGENQLLPRVIRAFQTSALRLMAQSDEARRAANWAGTRHVAHTLKSSSASIGAIRLSQLCAEIETKIRTEQLENLDVPLDAMAAELEIVLQALQRLLDATP